MMVLFKLQIHKPRTQLGWERIVRLAYLYFRLSGNRTMIARGDLKCPRIFLRDSINTIVVHISVNEVNR